MIIQILLVLYDSTIVAVLLNVSLSMIVTRTVGRVPDIRQCYCRVKPVEYGQWLREVIQNHPHVVPIKVSLGFELAAVVFGLQRLPNVHGQVCDDEKCQRVFGTPFNLILFAVRTSS